MSCRWSAVAMGNETMLKIVSGMTRQVKIGLPP